MSADASCRAEAAGIAAVAIVSAVCASSITTLRSSVVNTMRGRPERVESTTAGPFTAPTPRRAYEVGGLVSARSMLSRPVPYPVKPGLAALMSSALSRIRNTIVCAPSGARPSARRLA